MPDENNQTTSTTTDTNQPGSSSLPTPPKPIVEEVPASEKPSNENIPPTMGENLPPDTLPPLPTMEEVPPTPGVDSLSTPSSTPPVSEPESVGSAAPNDTNIAEGLDIPPVITGGGKPKGRFGKKAIATILGVLLLIGGIGAGVTLVQREQEFSSEAGVYEGLSQSECGNTCANGFKCTWRSLTRECKKTETSCEPSGGSTPSPGGGSIGGSSACSTYTSQSACTGQCSPAGYQCQWKNNACSSSESRCSGEDIISGDYPEGGDYCNSSGCSTPAGKTCTIIRYHCDRNDNLGGGCSDNQTGASSTSLNFSGPSCGSEQIDIQCNDGTRDSVSKVYQLDCTSTQSTSTPGPTSTPTPPGLSARCLDVKAFDTEWNQLTADDLTTLSAGDVVRFTVAGTATSGTIGKARFTINGTLRAEVIAKRPGTQEFYDEYTIPEGVTSFSIKGEVNHPTIGWF